jgi:hypothetical protein
VKTTITGMFAYAADVALPGTPSAVGVAMVHTHC